MDTKFLIPNSLNKDYKLVRAASFSELSKSKKVIVQQIESRSNAKLLKQYSCEQIFDERSNTSHFKLSFEVLGSQQCEQTKNLQKVTQSRLFCTDSSKLEDTEVPNLENLSFTNKECEFPQIESSKSILAAPKLILDNKLTRSIINHHDSFHNFKENDMNIEELCDPSFKYKKSLQLNTRSNTLHRNSLIQDKQNSDKKTEIKVPTQKIMVRKLSFVFIILFPVIIGCLVLLNSPDVCDPHFNVNNISEELTNSIYGQDDAVKHISEFLSQLHNKSSFNVLVLVGGTGVGKSYTSEIIKSHVEANNILYFFPPLYTKNVAQSMLSICRCNLILLENLKNDDIFDAVNFVQNLKMMTHSDCILVILLFNSDSFGIEGSDYNLKYSLNLEKSVLNINKIFAGINLNPTVIKYTMLSKSDLEKCIKLTAAYHNIVLKNNEIDVVSNELIKTGSGCKGSYSRLRIVQQEFTQSKIHRK